MTLEADVLSPCALGAILTEQSHRRLNVPIVAGGANNQLATTQDGGRIHGRGILYAPDYVINAGGIINVSTEYLGDGGAEPGPLAHRGHPRPARADLVGERLERARPGRGRRRHGAAADRPRLSLARCSADRLKRAAMHGYANPARFLRFARPATGWFLGLGLLLIAAGVVGGLFVTPPDYLQGESVRILYVHVPAAWLGMAGWAGIAVASLMQIGLAPSACRRSPDARSRRRARPLPLCAWRLGRSGADRPGAPGGNGTGA